MRNTHLIIFITFFFFTINCIGQIIVPNELSEDIKENVREFRSEYITNNQSLVILYFKNSVTSTKPNYMIHRVNSLSFIYNFHFSYITLVDEIPVLISSKTDGYFDINKINIEMTSMLTKYLDDDMLMSSIEILNPKTMTRDTINGTSLSLTSASQNLYIDHLKPWKIIDGHVHKEWKKDPYELGLMIENESYDGKSYYRVIDGGIDDRKFKMKN